jgi:hypothetical protein
MPEISDRCQDDRMCFDLARIACVKVINHEVLNYQKADVNSSTDLNKLALGWDLLFTDYKSDIDLYAKKNSFSFHMITVSGFYVRARDYSSAASTLWKALSSSTISFNLIALFFHAIRIYLKELFRKFFTY